MHHQREGSERENTWNVTMGFIQDEMKRQKRDTVDLSFCVQAVGSEQSAAKTITQPQEKLLEDKNEIIANTLWRTLEIRDIVDATKHTQTVWGRAFALTKQVAHQEAMLTALELIRFNVLTNKNYSKVYSPNTQPNMVLVTRVFSLLAMQLKSAPWSGPFNRDLLVFNSFVKALGRSYRNLCEMFALSFFMNGLAKKERSDYFQIADSLPFMSDVNVALGLVAQHYLESRASGQSTQDALLSTEKSFPTCVSVKSDLERGFQLWSNLMEAVQLLFDAGEIDRSILTMFTDADQWLQDKAI
ncbi:hypothetical protein K501DRAFT_174508 [Backusella circina FSU 941]|nr:hypothetical protein K501DRAFT_174508 [Backusella circina FSU 941]